MTIPSRLPTPPSAPVAPTRWRFRAAAHVLGAGLLTVALIALPAAPSDLDRHQLPKEMVLHLAVWLAVAIARPVHPIGLSRAMRWFAALLIGWSVLSSVFATNPWLAFRATALTVSGIAAFVTARHLAAAGASSILLCWTGIAACLAAGTGLAQAYGIDSAFFAAARAPGGTFGNRNFAAHFATIALPALGTLALTSRRTSVALLGALAAVPPVMMIVLSRSRAAWLGALAAGGVLVLVMVLQRRREHAPWLGRMLLLGGAATVGAALALWLPNTLQWRTDSPYAETLSGIANHREGSGRGRVLQYQNTMALALAHPVVGVGPGNWPIHYGDVAPSDDPSWSRGDVIPLNPWPSSDWMALASERGLPAVLIVAALGLAMLWRAWRGMRIGGTNALAAAGLAGVVIAVAVQGAFDAIVLLAAPLLLTAISTGALLERADGGVTLLDEELTPRLPMWWNAVLLILGVAAARSTQQVAAYLVAGNGRPTSRLVWAARIDPWSFPIRIALANREPCRAARDDAQMAVRLAPTWPSARVAARRCGVR